MTIIFGSPQANVILKKDKELIKALKAYEAGGGRIEEIKAELETIREEIEMADEDLGVLNGRENALVDELQRLEKGNHDANIRQ